MLDFACVPFGGGERHRQTLQTLLELFKSAVSPDVHTSRCGINRRDANPAILYQFLQGWARINHLAQAVRRRLDHEENADGLVDFNHLPGQSGAKIAGVAIHHTQQRGDVVREFGAAAVAVIVHEREVVFETDPRAHRDHSGHERREIFIGGSRLAS